jgi:hypothetical protein
MSSFVSYAVPDLAFMSTENEEDTLFCLYFRINCGLLYGVGALLHVFLCQHLSFNEAISLFLYGVRVAMVSCGLVLSYTFFCLLLYCMAMVSF